MKRHIWLLLHCLFLLVLSVSIAFMPVERKLLKYIVGGLFWLGLLGTASMALLIDHSRRTCSRFQAANKGKKQLGLIHFFRNPTAICADILLFLAAIGLAAANWLNGSLYLKFALLAVLVFAFGMHCILNGLNYIYLTSATRRRKGA